jgi:hypothetical protein
MNRIFGTDGARRASRKESGRIRIHPFCFAWRDDEQ